MDFARWSIRQSAAIKSKISFSVVFSLFLEYKFLLHRLLYGLRSALALCNRSFDYYILHFWNVDFHILRIVIIYNPISWYSSIIYFYILRQYTLTVWAGYFAAARTFFKILSSGTRHCSCLRSGLWNFIKIKAISRSGNQIALIYQFVKLIVIGRSCHANGLSDRYG